VRPTSIWDFHPLINAHAWRTIKTPSISGRRFHIHKISSHPCITGRNLYPYMRLGPHRGGESVNLKVCITCVWAGMDSVWEQRKFEAKNLENASFRKAPVPRFRYKLS